MRSARDDSRLIRTVHGITFLGTPRTNQVKRSGVSYGRHVVCGFSLDVGSVVPNEHENTIDSMTTASIMKICILLIENYPCSDHRVIVDNVYDESKMAFPFPHVSTTAQWVLFSRYPRACNSLYWGPCMAVVCDLFFYSKPCLTGKTLSWVIRFR